MRIGPGVSRSLFFWTIGRARRFGGVARSVAEGLAGAARAPAQRRPGIGHPAVGCLYPQITAEQERATLDGADSGRDIGGGSCPVCTVAAASGRQAVRQAHGAQHRTPEPARSCCELRPDQAVRRQVVSHQGKLKAAPIGGSRKLCAELRCDASWNRGGQMVGSSWASDEESSRWASTWASIV